MTSAISAQGNQAMTCGCGSATEPKQPPEIKANDGNDVVHIHLNWDGSADVTFNGVEKHYSAEEAKDMVVNTGKGNDNVTITGYVSAQNNPNIVINAGEGDDVVKAQLDPYGSTPNITMNGDGGDDHLVGGTVINGGAGDDYIRGGDLGDVVFPAVVDPAYERIFRPNVLSGGEGNDTIVGGNGQDIISGGEGNDIINARGGDDYVKGDGGDDEIVAGAGNDWIDGGSGHDRLSGEEGSDHIKGGEGNDFITGGNGDDHIWGENGDDTLWGEAGQNHIYGGLGSDDRHYKESLDSQHDVDGTMGKSGNPTGQYNKMLYTIDTTEAPVFTEDDVRASFEQQKPGSTESW